MLNKRCRSILLEIIKQPHTTDELAHMYHISNRSIRNDINEINFFLVQNNFPRITKNSNKQWLFLNNDTTEKIIFSIVNTPENVTTSYTKNERILELFYKLASQQGSIKIETLANELLVSKSSIIKDIEELKKILQPYLVNISGSNTGIELVGSENAVRISLLNIFFSKLDKKQIYDLIQLIDNPDSITSYNVYWRLFENVDIDLVKNQVENLKYYFSTHLSDFMYLYTYAAISLMYKRKEKQDKNFIEIKYPKILKIILNNISLNPNDNDYIFHICLQICPSLYLMQFKDPIIHLLEEKCSDLFKKIESVFFRKLTTDEQMILQRELLYIYIEKRIMHLEFSRVIELDDKLYHSIFEKIEMILQELSLPFSFTNDDIWRITWHIIPWTQTNYSKKQVLIVSDKPQSLIQILIQTLKQKFDIEIIGVTSLLQMKKYFNYYKIDYILSTMNITNTTNVLKVHPLLQEKELNYLKRFLDTHEQQANLISSSNFVTYHIKICIEKEIDEIFTELDHTLIQNNIISHSISKLLMNYFIKINKPFIYKNTLILNLREHEIINQNCAIYIQYTNNSTIKKKLFDAEKTIVIFAKSVEDYVNFINIIFNDSPSE